MIVGAGYGGLAAMRRLGRAADRVQVTLVSDTDTFVERVRLHELAVGRRQATHRLPRPRRGTITLGRVVDVDPGARWVSLADGAAIEYDSLILATGSAARWPAVPGAALGHAVGDRAAALRLQDRLRTLPPGSWLTVVGGGLTGVELAAEAATAGREWRVRLITAGRVGAWLRPAAAQALRRQLARLGVHVVEGVLVSALSEEAVATRDGDLPSALTVWATGFTPSPLAGAAGLETDVAGRMIVDGALAAPGHPSVLGVGDIAVPAGDDALRMACQTAIPMGWHAARTVAARAVGRPAPEFRMRYVWTNTSVGRRDGLTQVTRSDDAPTRLWWTGPAAAAFKELITRSAAATVLGRR